MDTKDYAEETAKLREVFLGDATNVKDRLEAWAEWCELFDAKEAAEKSQALACEEYAL